MDGEGSSMNSGDRSSPEPDIYLDPAPGPSWTTLDDFDMKYELISKGPTNNGLAKDANLKRKLRKQLNKGKDKDRNDVEGDDDSDGEDVASCECRKKAGPPSAEDNNNPPPSPATGSNDDANANAGMPDDKSQAGDEPMNAVANPVPIPGNHAGSAQSVNPDFFNLIVRHDMFMDPSGERDMELAEYAGRVHGLIMIVLRLRNAGIDISGIPEEPGPRQTWLTYYLNNGLNAGLIYKIQKALNQSHPECTLNVAKVVSVWLNTDLVQTLTWRDVSPVHFGDDSDDSD